MYKIYPDYDIEGDHMSENIMAEFINDEVMTISGVNYIKIVLPEGMNVLEEELFNFSGNDCIKSVIVPDSVHIISYSVFLGCGNLKYVNIPNGVNNLPYASFGACNSLKEIRIPNSVTTISNKAFKSYDIKCNLNRIYYDGTIDQWNNICIIDGYGIEKGFIVDEFIGATIICSDGQFIYTA